MPKLKVYECCICHKILEDYKPIRLAKQKYESERIKQYRTVRHYDFCIDCYKRFHYWIKKHKED